MMPTFTAISIVSGFIRLLGCAAVIFGLQTSGVADDWPQWLGPNRDGVWRESGILDRFPEGGPPVVWRQPIRAGYSGPAVADERLYVLDRNAATDEDGNPIANKDGIPGTERVLCLDTKDGATLWEHEYDSTYKISYPSGPRTTPVVDGDRVYTLGAVGELICFDNQTGDIQWSRNFLQDYCKKPPVWGWAAHPLIDGDRLITLVGGVKTGVVAFDKRTGDEVWRALHAKEIGYAPPVIYEAAGRRQLIVWHDVAVNGLDPETGERLWSVPFPAGTPQRPSAPIGTPKLMGDLLFVSSFYDGALALQLTDDKPGATLAWKSNKAKDPFHGQAVNVMMMTPALKDGCIYAVSGLGQFRCLDADTGEVLWRDYAPLDGKRANFATCFLIEHEDRFFIFNDRGELILARLTRGGYDEIDRVQLLEATQFVRGRDVVWSHPAFADRSMFARNDKEIIRVDLSAQAGNP